MSPIRRKIPTPPDGQMREAEMVEIKSSHETPNSYELSDGTVLTLRLVVNEIWRVDDVYDNEGNPLYVTKSSNIATVTAAEELRRKTS